MTPLTRTLTFIRGTPVDRPPFHPIMMRWAAGYAGVKYGAFCTDPHTKCDAAIRCAEDFDIDWVTVMSHPYAEAQAFGVDIEYPEDDLPLARGGLLPDLDAVRNLEPYRVEDHRILVNRIREIELFARRVGDTQVLSGNCDPVGIVQNGDADAIHRNVRRAHQETGGRAIVSAGCEVPPGTPAVNMHHFRRAAHRLGPVESRHP